MLVRCLYASRATATLDPAALDAILRQSHKNNPLRGITGLLFLKDDTFLQVIEGGRAEIGHLLTAIFKDSRHTDVQILSFADIQERHFGSWTMGHVKAAHINPAMLLKYSERAELNPFNCTGTATMALMMEFASTNAIATRPM